MSQTPTIGRIVHYKLGPNDVAAIEAHRRLYSVTVAGNPVEVGQVYPALIVRTWGSTTVQLQVFLDGNDTHWGSSRTEGDGEYQWTWPQR